jgi:peptide-methionine (S)-S-oxide reductase
MTGDRVRRRYGLRLVAALALGLVTAAAVGDETSDKAKSTTKAKKPMKTSPADQTKSDESKLDTATFGAGCFWCVEAVFQQMKGVEQVKSGYAGGHVENPTYEQVCTGETGHAEVIQIKYDPKVVSFDELLEVFWKTHDPTTLNRQGNDVGTQYRSAVFYHDEKQKALAEKYKAELDEAGAFSGKIVTEITPAAKFYEAEEYHQNYYKNNPSQGYCRVVIAPKVDKFRKVFKDKLKAE